jgi:hypothetical protein
VKAARPAAAVRHWPARALGDSGHWGHGSKAGTGRHGGHGSRPGLACTGGTECRHWSALGARSVGPALACIGGTERRPKAGTGGMECPAVGRHWPALGARSAGRRPALGHGVLGRRPALHSLFGHCLHLGSKSSARADDQNHTYRAIELEHHATEDRRRRPSCREGVCDKKGSL